MDGETNDDDDDDDVVVGEDEGGRLNSWRRCGGTFLTF